MNKCYRIIFFIIFSSIQQRSVSTILNNYASKHSIVVKKVMVQLLRNCYSNYQTVVTCDENDDFLSQSLLETSSISSIVYSTNAQIEHKIISFDKVDAFIISTNSTGHMNKTLASIKNTPHWDIKSTFFILSDSIDDCSEASTILQTAWDRNLISAYYICLNREPVIYTFNPYASRAPRSWTLSAVFNRRKNRWTLYSRKYRKGQMCSDFDFDRVKYFDGANISIVSCTSSTLPGVRMGTHGLIIADTMSQVLNFSALRTEADPALKRIAELEGFYLLLANASAEFAVCCRSINSRLNFSVSYPTLRNGFQIISNHQGFYTPLEKICNFYGKWVSLLTLLIIIITYFVIIISNGRRNYSFATFEILRFLTNLGFLTTIDTSAKRIFFCVILIYSVILQATFQGQLSTFLTKQKSRENAETIKSLQASHFEQVFATRSVQPLLELNSHLKEKVRLVDSVYCVNEILGKKSSVCVNWQFIVMNDAITHKLYLSKKLIAEDGTVFFFRHDCPLEDRVNEFFIRLEQTGLTKVWSEGLVSEDLMRLTMIEQRSIINFRSITVKDVAFTFYLLIIGLTLASIVFILEILLNRYHSNIFLFISQLY